MSWKDRLEAQGRGVAQTLTGGWNDELVAKLIQAMPTGDDTGIPREYAGGQYEQYRNEQRADEADSQRRYPANFASGQILGAVPGTVATLSLGGLPAVGLAAGQGAVAGAGHSQAQGRELAKDAARGAAVGGALAAAGNAAQAAAPALKALWRQGPPPSGPAVAHAGAAAGPPTTRTPTRPQLNFSKSDLPVEKVSGAASVDPVDQEALAALRRFDNQKPLSLGDEQLPGAKREVDPAAMEAARKKLGEMDPDSYLGEGWARKVYDDKGQAAKIAKAPRGILQNEAEVKVWESIPAEKRKTSVLNPVVSHSPDFSQVNQRLVEPLDTGSISKYMGMAEEGVEDRLRQMAHPDFQGPWPTAESQELQERMRQALQEAPIVDYQDVGKASQWGLDKRGKPVLIDYGFLKGMPLAVAGGAAAAEARNR